MLGLDYFSWSAKWSPYFMAFTVVVAVLYLLFTGKYRHLIKDSKPVPFKTKFSFITGLLITYIAFGSPIDLLGHIMFSFHMASMSLAFLVAPPLLWLGSPDWLVRAGLKRIAPRVLRILTNPVITLLLFNALFSFYHMPVIHDFVMTNYTAHTVYYIILFVSAMMMWWNIVLPVPEYERLTDIRKMFYVMASGVLLTPACALIIFAGTPVYEIYSDSTIWAQAMGYCVPGVDMTVLLQLIDGPSQLQLLPPVQDQQAGGVLMKLTQETIYAGILFYLFKNWFRKENPGGSSGYDDDELDVPVPTANLNRV